MPLYLVYITLEPIHRDMSQESTFSKQTGSILYVLWLHIMGRTCHLSRSRQSQPYLLPSATPANIHACSPPFLPPRGLHPQCLWSNDISSLQQSWRQDSMQGHLDTGPASSPGGGNGLIDSEFGYRTGRVSCFKMLSDTQGTDWLYKFLPKSLK